MQVTWHEPLGTVICPQCLGNPKFVCTSCNGIPYARLTCTHVAAVPLYAAGGVPLYLACGDQAHEIVEA